MKTKISKNNSFISEIKDYSLNNVDNYNKILNYTSYEIIEKYILLINEFLKFVLEKTKVKNNHYSKFIIIRGYDTITNVFNIILFYTKNLDLTFYHCQKGYYYYIEFIEQISNIDHVLLQLNSKDASTYVYKKTIFELDNEIQQKINNDINSEIKIILTNIDENIKVFKNIFDFIMDFVIMDNYLYVNMEIIDKFTTLCQKIFSKNNNNIKNIYNKIEEINNDFSDNFLNNNINVTDDINIIVEKYLVHITMKWKS